MDIFKEPALVAALQFKWEAYGAYKFWWSFFLYVIELTSFTFISFEVPKMKHQFCTGHISATWQVRERAALSLRLSCVHARSFSLNATPN